MAFTIVLHSRIVVRADGADLFWFYPKFRLGPCPEQLLAKLVKGDALKGRGDVFAYSLLPSFSDVTASAASIATTTNCVYLVRAFSYFKYRISQVTALVNPIPIFRTAICHVDHSASRVMGPVGTSPLSSLSSSPATQLCIVSSAGTARGQGCPGLGELVHVRGGGAGVNATLVRQPPCEAYNLGIVLLPFGDLVHVHASFGSLYGCRSGID
ncbi:hypothetical protein EDB86DRAFT_2983093, partial [Lactarius hatsudake]